MTRKIYVPHDLKYNKIYSVWKEMFQNPKFNWIKINNIIVIKIEIYIMYKEKYCNKIKKVNMYPYDRDFSNKYKCITKERKTSYLKFFI